MSVETDKHRLLKAIAGIGIGTSEAAAILLEEEFSYCEDSDFEASCWACLASHLMRVLREEPTPTADRFFAHELYPSNDE